MNKITDLNLDIDLRLDPAETGVFCPPAQNIRLWIQCALKHASRTGTLSLKLMNESEIAELNAHYRKKNKPTNVLSFPCRLPAPLRGAILGDIVICPAVLAQEALSQNKPPIAHWAHIVVHGVLHLLEYDHENEQDATRMENLEVNILADLGFEDPYGAEKIDE